MIKPREIFVAWLHHGDSSVLLGEVPEGSVPGEVDIKHYVPSNSTMYATLKKRVQVTTLLTFLDSVYVRR